MNPAILVFDRSDDLRQALVRAAPDLESAIVGCHQTARAEAELARGWPLVLVAGPSALTGGGARFLEKAHTERPALITVLVTNRRGPDVPMRDLVRTGASDLVRFPAAAATLRKALQRALEMAGTVNASSSKRMNRSANETQGATITVTSPTGGCGKTFFATNAAYELAAHSAKRVALLDLDLQFGEVSTALRLRPAHTITDLLARRAEVGDEEAAEELRAFATHHSSGVEVLAAPSDPAEADAVTSPDVSWLVQAARDTYDYVIIDTPPALTEEVLAAFDLSDGLVVMATLDLPSVKNLGVFLSTLDRLKIPPEGISLLLNKAESDVGLSPAEVQRLFRQDFVGVLPYSKDVSRSVNAGRPVLESAGGSEVARALAASIRTVLQTGSPSAALAGLDVAARAPRPTRHRWMPFARPVPDGGVRR